MTSAIGRKSTKLKSFKAEDDAKGVVGTCSRGRRLSWLALQNTDTVNAKGPTRPFASPMLKPNVLPSSYDFLRVRRNMKYSFPLLTRKDDKTKNYVAAMNNFRDGLPRFPDKKLWNAYHESNGNFVVSESAIRHSVQEKEALARKKFLQKKRSERTRPVRTGRSRASHLLPSSHNPFRRNMPNSETLFLTSRQRIVGTQK